MLINFLRVRSPWSLVQTDGHTLGAYHTHTHSQHTLRTTPSLSHLYDGSSPALAPGTCSNQRGRMGSPLSAALRAARCLCSNRCFSSFAWEYNIWVLFIVELFVGLFAPLPTPFS